MNKRKEPPLLFAIAFELLEDLIYEPFDMLNSFWVRLTTPVAPGARRQRSNRVSKPTSRMAEYYESPLP